MSNLSQEQKTKVNNFLRSLNQRITNFIEEMIDESSNPDQKKDGGQRRADRQIGELDQLLDELQNPQSAHAQRPPQKKNKRDKRRRDNQRDDQRSDGRPPTPKKEAEVLPEQPVIAPEPKAELSVELSVEPVVSPPAEPSPIPTEAPVTPPEISPLPEQPSPDQIAPESLLVEPAIVEPTTQEPANIPAPEQNISEELPSQIQSEQIPVPVDPVAPVTDQALPENPLPQSPEQSTNSAPNDFSQISNLLDRVEEKQS